MSDETKCKPSLGPWKLEVKREVRYCYKTGKREPDRCSTFLRDAKGVLIGIFGQDEPGPDALLLVAAPEMLAALKQIAECEDTDGEENRHPWNKIARAAIAKAELGEPAQVPVKEGAEV